MAGMNVSFVKNYKKRHGFSIYEGNITCCLLRSWEFEGWQPDGTTALHWTHNWQYLFNKNCPTCLRRLWWSKYWLSCKSCSILRMNTSDARVLSSFCSWNMNLNCYSPLGMYSTFLEGGFANLKSMTNKNCLLTKLTSKGHGCASTCVTLWHHSESISIHQHQSASIPNPQSTSISISIQTHQPQSASINVNQHQSIRNK